MDYADSVGLKINFQKSTLVPINLSPQDSQELADIFQCSVGAMPFTYLGLPMGTTKPTVTDLMPLVGRVERKLSSTLCMSSYGARLTLVDSVLTSTAVYAMCSIRIPPKILDHLDKLRRLCLWRKKTDTGESSNSLAAWGMVCKPKLKGGLGIINTKTLNTALLMKFLDKFYNHHDVPRVELVWNTYYTHAVPHAAGPCGSFWWREIIHLMPSYRGITTVTIGDG